MATARDVGQRHPPAPKSDPLRDFYVGLGRLAAEAGDLEQACDAYRKALQCCHLAEVAANGRHDPSCERVNREYASVLLGRLPTAA